jgi:photosystem II stability/assembly factor-like uncharacterized protein
MDELRKDLRALFERRQAGLGEIRGERETVMRRALARRDEPLGGRLNIAAGIAAVVIAALVIATFAYVRGRSVGHEGPLPGASSARVATPVVKPPSKPPRTAILDVDLVDLSTGWVLFTNCVQPTTGTCHYSVVATTDGGGSWSKPVQVGGQLDPTNGDAPRSVHFLNKSDGFVYGGAGAFVTHDRGRTWARLNIPAVFVEFITGRGSVAWAATYPCGKGTSCPYEIRASVDGGRTWSSPHEVPASLPPLRGVPFATSGLVVATFTDLLITFDGGATWSVIKTACTSAVFQEEIATSDGRELWLLCTDSTQAGPAKKKLYVSDAAGVTWKQRVISQPSELKPGTNGVDGIVSLAAGSLLFNPGVVGVVITHDTGATWAKAGPDVRFGNIRFCSASDGWARDDENYIWATSDGGDHWTQVTAIQIQSP